MNLEVDLRLEVGMGGVTAPPKIRPGVVFIVNGGNFFCGGGGGGLISLFLIFMVPLGLDEGLYPMPWRAQLFIFPYALEAQRMWC